MSELPGQNLLSQLLGIDPQQANGKAQKSAGTPRPGPMPSAHATASAIQGVKLSTALKGLNITSNFMWLVLFVGFFLWLFVVYWIRHHEPFANHVLGPAASHSSTGRDDRIMLEGMRNAMPVRISKDTGFVYVPNKPEVTGQFGQPATQSASLGAPANNGCGVPAPAHAAPVVVNQPPAATQYAPAPVLNPLGAPQTTQPLQQPVLPPLSQPYYGQGGVPLAMPGAGQTVPMGTGSVYMVPRQTQGGRRVQMVVNR